MSHGLLAHLQRALIRIATYAPRFIVTPHSQPRSASVALIVRVRPAVEDEQWLAAKWRSGNFREEDAHLFPSTGASILTSGKPWNEHRNAPASVLFAAVGAARYC